MTEIAEKPKREVEAYTTADIERALTEVAACNGNVRQAEANLDADPDARAVPKSTLHEWKTRHHVERYAAIRAEQLPKIREQAADQHMALAQRSMEVEDDLLALLAAKKDELPARDLAGAIRNLSVDSGVHTQNAQLLNDQPTERRAIDLPGTLQELKSLGVEPKHVLNLTPVAEEDVETGSSSEAGLTPRTDSPGP